MAHNPGHPEGVPGLTGDAHDLPSTRRKNTGMDRWLAMRVFVKVAETESFAKTARLMHMSAPAVTRIVAALEDLVGARLLVRTTRSVKTTEAGAHYLADCQRILGDIADAEAAAAGHYSEPSGTLAITAPILFGQMYVLPILTEYLDTFPAMHARTLFIDRQVNIVEEGLDLAVRIGHLADSGLTAVRVGTVRHVICAAPGYLQTRGIPHNPVDLKHHRIVASNSSWASPEWRFAGGQRISIDPVLMCNTNQAVIEAARSGWGLTRVLHYQVGPALREGELQIVLEAFEEPPLPIHLVYPEGRQAPAKVRAFVDMAVERLRRDPLFG